MHLKFEVRRLRYVVFSETVHKGCLLLWGGGCQELHTVHTKFVFVSTNTNKGGGGESRHPKKAVIFYEHPHRYSEAII